MRPPRAAQRAAAFLTAVWASGVGVTEAQTPPPGPPSPAFQTMPGPAVVKALVVRSWSFALGELAWEELNQSWSRFGTTPLFID